MFCLAERTPQKRRGDGAGDEENLGVRLLRKGNREIFGVAELMMGANHIPGEMHRWRDPPRPDQGEDQEEGLDPRGDILIVVPWSFQDERCDIIHRYTGPQVEWLKRNRYL